MATEQQFEGMLKGIHDHEGNWNNVESQVVDIGRGNGLDEQETFDLLKSLMDKGYVDPGRNKDSKSHWLQRGSVVLSASKQMYLTGKGRQYIGV